MPTENVIIIWSQTNFTIVFLITTLLSSSPRLSNGPPGSSVGCPLSKSFQSLIWADSRERTPAPIPIAEPPWCPQSRSYQSRSDRKAREPGQFSPPRTRASPHRSPDEGASSAPSSQREPGGPTGQWRWRPLEWREVMSPQLWREETCVLFIFINSIVIKGNDRNIFSLLPWGQSS